MNPFTNGKPKREAQLKLETRFDHEGEKHFPTFCLTYATKAVRNALFSKKNALHIQN